MKINPVPAVLVSLFCFISGAKLPSDFKICQRTDLEQFSICFKSAIQEALPKMKNGLSSPKLPPVDPLEIPSATIGEGKGPVHVVQHFKNLKIYGVSNTIIDDVKGTLSPPTFEFIMKGHAPEYRLESNYEMDGQMLLLPIRGQGNNSILLKNFEIGLDISGEFIDKEGTEYLKVKNIITTFNTEKAIYKYDNLFNGDETLGNQINTLINDNWREVFDDLAPPFRELLSIIFKNYINGLFDKVKADDLMSK